MMSRIGRLVIAISIGFVFLGAGRQSGAEDFYRGKTIRFIVGAPAGGGYDTDNRAITRHLGKHIPGNPSLAIFFRSV